MTYPTFNNCNQIEKLVGLSELELNELGIFAALHDIAKSYE
jgi:HD-GYP domain-containing protein (c-di-GMP phosphodiesterase class II)